MRFGVEDNIYEAIIERLKKEPTLIRAILFGSRARGTERYNSDIDLAIECTGEVPASLILDIDEAAGIYKVDMVDIKGITNGTFRKSIEDEGVNLLNGGDVK